LIGVFLETVAVGLTLGSVYALIAIGFSFVFASTRVVNFAQGDWAMIAGMFAAALVGSGVSLPLAIVVAPIVGAVVGYVTYALFLGRSRSTDAMTISLILLGMSFLLQGTAVLIWGPEPLGITQIGDLPPLHFAGAVLPATSVLVLITTAMLLGLVVVFLSFTKVGRATLAISQNAEAAALHGINVRALILLSFLLSGVLAGVAGFLVTPITSMFFQGGVPLTFKGFAAAAIGGLRRPAGAVVGGFVLGMLEAFAAAYVGRGNLGPELGLLLPLVVLLIVAPRLQSSGTRSEESMEAISHDVAADRVHL